MRRYWVLALAVLTLLAGLAPPAFAQAPTPKVTITGLIDFVTTYSNNHQDVDATRKEAEWYSRQRGRLDFIGELGQAKMVWGIELDFVNGNTVTAHAGSTAGFDLDTDVAGAVETKWLYLQFPFTGKGSLLPFIDVPSTARGGGQPFTGHDYKFGILASGDFGGFNVETTFAPTVKNIFTVVQIEEENAKTEKVIGPGTTVTRSLNRESWALIDSLSFSPTKELTVKPTVSFARYQGANQGSGGLGTPGVGGLAVGTLPIWRWTVGGDLRWTSGPWSLEPTFHYQGGTHSLPDATVLATGKKEADISAWILDMIGGWRSGPLNVEGRFTYSSGNKADECVQTIAAGGCRGASSVNHYAPINPGFAYYAGWSEIWTTGATDYYNCFLCGASGSRRTNLGYDKYGMIALVARATYSLTPDLSWLTSVGPTWTAETVDVNNSAAIAAATGISPGLKTGETQPKGDQSYLGTEIIVGPTFKFAPGLTFDLRYAHLFAGDALNQCQSAACPADADVRKAKDVDLLTARVRYTF